MNTFLAKTWRQFHLSKLLQLFIMRLFQDQFLVGVVGIIFNSKNEVLLFKHTYRQTPWSLPGGYMKAGEHPREGLAREIEEESGFVVSIDERMYIKTDRQTARLEICYIGTFIGGEFRKSGEVSDFGFFSFESLPLISKRQLLLIQKAITNREVLKQSKNTVPETGIFTKFRALIKL